VRYLESKKKKNKRQRSHPKYKEKSDQKTRVPPNPTKITKKPQRIEVKNHNLKISSRLSLIQGYHTFPHSITPKRGAPESVPP
jgi:hypothetical protein